MTYKLACKDDLPRLRRNSRNRASQLVSFGHVYECIADIDIRHTKVLVRVSIRMRTVAVLMCPI